MTPSSSNAAFSVGHCVNSLVRERSLAGKPCYQCPLYCDQPCVSGGPRSVSSGRLMLTQFDENHFEAWMPTKPQLVLVCPAIAVLAAALPEPGLPNTLFSNPISLASPMFPYSRSLFRPLQIPVPYLAPSIAPPLPLSCLLFPPLVSTIFHFLLTLLVFYLGQVLDICIPSSLPLPRPLRRPLSSSHTRLLSNDCPDSCPHPCPCNLSHSFSCSCPDLLILVPFLS